MGLLAIPRAHRARAKRLLARLDLEVRRITYAEACEWVRAKEVRAGTEIHPEAGELSWDMMARWDDREGGSVHVFWGVVAGGWSAFCPLSRDTIIEKPPN